MSRFVVLLLIAATVSLTMAHSLRMQRQPHHFEPTPWKQPTSWKQAGRSIPMSGGVLTLGAYFVQLSVGTGAGLRVFDALVDTGSSNTAVPAVGCATCGNPPIQYNDTASPTSTPLSCSSLFCNNCRPTSVGSSDLPADWFRSCRYQPLMCSDQKCGFGISYGGSSSAIEGTISQDTICFNGTNFCAPNAYVYEITGAYPAGNLNMGILGLAFPANACNPTCQPTLLDSMVTAGVLTEDQNLFGMCLTPNNGGVIDLGFLDSAKYTGTMQYTAVVKNHWFNINIKDIRIGGVSIGVPSFLYNIRNDAIGSFVDSGTSTVLVSPYTFQVISSIFATNYSSLPYLSALFSGNNCANFTDPSHQIAQYPSIDFVMEGTDGEASDFPVTMSGVNYLMSSGNGATYCLGIQGVPSVAVILGDIIMENYYIAFDRVKSRMGFTPIKSC